MNYESQLQQPRLPDLNIAAVWIFRINTVTAEREYLLIKRSSKEQFESELWGMVTETSQRNEDEIETLTETALRGIKEELFKGKDLGITEDKLVSLRGPSPYDYHGLKIENQVFAIQVDPNIEIEPETDEISEYVWITLKQLKTMSTAYFIEDMLNHLQLLSQLEAG
jgi:isopentenyldiphosphate isomerase